MSSYVDKHEIEFWKHAYNKKWEDIRSYQSTIDARNKDIADLQNENENLKKDVDKLREERERLQSGFEGAVKDNLRILEEKEKYMRELDTYKQQVENLQFDNEHLQKDVDEKDLQIAALKDRVGDLRLAIERQDKEISKMDGLKKELEYWKTKDFLTKPICFPNVEQDVEYYKSKSNDLQRQLEFYKNLFNPIMDFLEMQKKSEK